MNPILWILLLIGSLPAFASERVRKIEVKPDQIVTVRTAIGIATIIQVPERPNSIVVGDQAGFKVEYLDQAITIKPLHSGARSNLYTNTSESKRDDHCGPPPNGTVFTRQIYPSRC
jgi:type IV secretory pathway VirB9-like protein